jgi:hypothetical protein
MISQDGDAVFWDFSLDNVDGMEIISAAKLRGRTHYNVNIFCNFEWLCLIIKAIYLEIYFGLRSMIRLRKWIINRLLGGCPRIAIFPKSRHTKKITAGATK